MLVPVHLCRRFLIKQIIDGMSVSATHQALQVHLILLIELNDWAICDNIGLHRYVSHSPESMLMALRDTYVVLLDVD